MNEVYENHNEFKEFVNDDKLRENLYKHMSITKKKNPLDTML